MRRRAGRAPAAAADEPKSAAPSQADASRGAGRAPPRRWPRSTPRRTQLLDGGADAFEERLAALRGYPVVVNKWGSWCGPCRAEFPYFQQPVGRAAASEVAFLGVDGQDNDADARKFLKEYPVAYPSYMDAHLKIAAVIKAVAGLPVDGLLRPPGEDSPTSSRALYANERELAADIERYAR